MGVKNRVSPYKIRQVNKKSDSLEISLHQFMAKDGYQAGAFAEWERLETGEWKLKLKPKQEGAKTEVPVENQQVITHE